ncbi:hypothetical protein HanOQP8_Chr00c009g0684861 [Helianthus annuus]|nr:hypothetical protein HanOQP8_Chr00c009g0684861 [Helianthus annuus]
MQKLSNEHDKSYLEGSRKGRTLSQVVSHPSRWATLHPPGWTFPYIFHSKILSRSISCYEARLTEVIDIMHSQTPPWILLKSIS